MMRRWSWAVVLMLLLILWSAKWVLVLLNIWSMWQPKYTLVKVRVATLFRTASLLMCLWMYIGSHVTGNDVTWPEVTRKWRHLNHQLANIHIEQQAVYKIRVRLISHITPLHTCRAVAMRFEVVRLQWGVTLPKAMAQRRVVPIIPCKVRKIFSPSFLGYQDGLSWHLRAWKTRKCCFQTICSHRSLLCQLWPRGCQLVCQARHRIQECWQKCGCCLEKWSGWNWTNHTGGYSPDI